MKKLKYKGYTVSQASNKHVMITKDDKMVFHANCSKELNKEELKKQVEWFIKLFGSIDIVEVVDE